MVFIKQFNQKGGIRGRRTSVGTLIIEGDYINMRIDNQYRVRERGLIEGGIGCVIEKKTTKSKSPYTLVRVRIDPSYLPEELRGEGYRFWIEGEKLSDTEVVFMFKNARMLNKK